MRPYRQFAHLLVSGMLLVGLVGVLIVNLAIVVDLPSRVYTSTQLEYLNYNRGRSISQVAPTWDVITPEGMVESAILSYARKSRVRATLTARYEEYEGVSATVYDLDFHGEYHLVYDGPLDTTVQLHFPFPRNLETLHEVRLAVDGEEPPEVQYTTTGISWQSVLPAGAERQIEISYKADGANSFAYGLYHNQRSDVDVAITVVGLAGSKVPKTSLPPTANEDTDGGEILTWDYADLIVDRDIQLNLPARLSFAQRIAQLQDDFRALAMLAPFLVGLFLASLAAVLHLGGVRLPLASYLLTGCGLALFYPLLTFLSGIVDLAPAAILALLLVSGLVLVFLSLATGWQQSGWRIGLLLIIFLGFFSLGMLTPWQGLLLTSGGLLLVGLLMLQYARRPPAPQPAPPPLPAGGVLEPEPAPPPDEPSPEPESTPPPDEAIQELAPAPLPPLPDEATPEPTGFHCPYCAHVLADDYGFCPGCGHDTSRFRRCADCGTRQFVPAEVEPVHCVTCGQSLMGDSRAESNGCVSNGL